MKRYYMVYTKFDYKATGDYKNEKEARRAFKELYGVEPDEITAEEIPIKNNEECI